MGFFRRRLTDGQIAILIYSLLTLIIFGKLLLANGTLGLFGDWPMPPLAEQIWDQSLRDTLSLWSEDFLGFLRTRQTGNYVDWLIGGLSFLSQTGGAVWSKYPILLLPLAGYTMFRLLRRLNLNLHPAFLGGLVYLLSPIVFNSFAYGYLKFFVSFAAAPWFLERLSEYIEGSPSTPLRTTRQLVLLGVAFGLVATQLNFLVLFGLFGVIYGLYLTAWEKAKLRRLGKATLAMALGAIILQLPFVVSLLLSLSRGAPLQASETLTGALQTFITTRSPTTFEAFSLLGRASEAFKESLDKTGLLSLWWFLRIPFLILVFLPLAVVRTRAVRFWGLTALITVFLLKGIEAPLGFVNQFFYETVPLFAVIRNSQTITFITIIAYGFLVATSAEWLLSLARMNARGEQKPKAKHIGVGLLIIVVMLNGLPFFYPGPDHFVKAYKVPNEVQRAFREAANAEGRVLWLPLLQPIARKHEAGELTGAGPNHLAWYPPKPGLFMGIAPDREPAIHALIFHLLQDPNSQWLGTILNHYGFSHIVVDKTAESRYSDFVVSHEHPELQEATSTSRLLKVLERQQDLEKLEENEAIARYRVARGGEAGRVSEPRLLIGDLNLLRAEAATASDEAREIPHGLFLDQLPGKTLRELQSTLGELWIGEGNELLLPLVLAEAEFLSPGSLIFDPSSDANHHWVALYKNQWWWLDRDLLSLREPIMTLGTESARLPLQAREAGRYEVFVKVFVGPEVNPLSVRLGDGEAIKLQTTAPERRGYTWFSLGEVALGRRRVDLQLENPLGGLQAVGAVALVQPEKFLAAKEEAGTILKTHPTIVVREVGERLSLALPTGLAESSAVLLERNEAIERYRRDEIQRITLDVSSAEYRYNLDDPSFESSLWTNPRSCDQAVSEPNIEASREPGGPDGRTYLRLVAHRGLACLSAPIRNFEPTSNYRILFWYRSVQGDNPHFSVVEDGLIDQMAPLALPKREAWSRYEYEFSPRRGARGASLVFYSNAFQGEATENHFDGVGISRERVGVKRIFFTNSAASVTPAGKPPRFGVVTSEVGEAGVFPGLIVHSTAYHPDWRLEGRPPELIVDGLFAGWPSSAKATEDRSTEFSFRGTTLYQLSNLLSLLGLLGALGWLGLRRDAERPKSPAQRGGGL